MTIAYLRGTNLPTKIDPVAAKVNEIIDAHESLSTTVSGLSLSATPGAAIWRYYDISYTSVVQGSGYGTAPIVAVADGSILLACGLRVTTTFNQVGITVLSIMDSTLDIDWTSDNTRSVIASPSNHMLPIIKHDVNPGISGQLGGDQPALAAGAINLVLFLNGWDGTATAGVCRCFVCTATPVASS